MKIMKKLFLLIVCAVLTIGARAQYSFSGNGTEADPYLIYDDIRLAQLANFLDQEGVYFELRADIDLTSYIRENNPTQGWAPIGVESAPFKGILKGNGHTISGLMINRPNNDHIGLFGYVNGARINDLTIKASNVTGRNYVSVLCGTSYGNCSFANCDVEISGKLSGLCDIGGIVGYMHEGSTISDCDVKGNIESKAGSSLACGTVGGIGGTVEKANVSNCTYNGSITAKVKYAGGLIGSIHGCSLNNCIVKCPVIGEESVGGLCGIACDTNTILNCRQEGNITGISNVSGGVGLLDANSNNTFTNVHHKGTITNMGDYTGGIIGKSDGGCIAGMESCSHFGDISGNNYVGGAVGAISEGRTTPHQFWGSTSDTYNSKGWGPETAVVEGTTSNYKISNCSAIGNITGSEYVGGLIGEDTPGVKLTFYEGYSSGSKQIYTYRYAWMDDQLMYNQSYSYIYVKEVLDRHICSLENSYFSGNIIGTVNVGGIVGYKEAGSIANCYTYAKIAGESNVGGISGTANGSVIAQSSSTLTLKSSVAINSSVTATSSNVGRIYGNRGEAVSIGALGSSEGNRALTQTSVMLCGVAQDIVDDEQNGTSVGPTMLLTSTLFNPYIPTPFKNQLIMIFYGVIWVTQRQKHLSLRHVCT